MKHIGCEKVTLNGGLLHDKQELNRLVTINAVYDRFKETGRFDAFDCNWKEGMPLRPHFFWDSDVAKWMEGAAYILAKHRDDELEAKVESLIDKIEEHQTEDGYFNTYFTVVEPGKRFTDRFKHELYCAGHLLEAALAYCVATDRSRFLILMEKYVDLIIKIFIEEKSAAFVTPGHPELELALMRAYRITGKKKYLDLAGFFIEERGKRVEDKTGRCFQSDTPIREKRIAEGHAVRLCYLYTGVADYAYETGDKELYEACRAIYDDIVERKMYITGGIGSTHFGEEVTVPYDLKNDRAYTETCAAISLMFFSRSMALFDNNSRYADLIERILYNGMMSGLSLDGRSFFYENPLAIDLKNYDVPVSHLGERDKYAPFERKAVFETSCCPPNLNRVLSSVEGYIYAYENRDVFVNQFMSSHAAIDGITVSQVTDYPRSGEVKITSGGAERVHVRIPSWCTDFDINVPYVIENGYAVIEATGREIIVNFKMTPFIVESNVGVYENCGKVAVCMGPYVMAAEGIDNGENLHSIFIDKNFAAKAEYCEELCGYTVAVKAKKKPRDNALYRRYTDDFEDFTLKLIPFAAFANRGPTNMCVWLNIR